MTPNDQVVFPGDTWRFGEFNKPIHCPLPLGPFDIEGDEQFLWFSLSFLVHSMALVRLYNLHYDKVQRQRWLQAHDNVLNAMGGVFGSAGRNLGVQAINVVNTVKITGSIGEEVSWSGHALWLLRQIEVAWKQNNARRMANITNAMEMVTRAIKTSLPEDYANDMLSEGICQKH